MHSESHSSNAPLGNSGTRAGGAGRHHLHITIHALALLALPLSGCKEGPSSRARYLQSRRLVGITAVQGFSDPVVSIEALARVQPVAGEVAGDRVVVDYPRGLRDLAVEIAAQAPRMAAFVNEQFGIKWTWQARLLLLRVEKAPSRFVERRTRLKTGVFSMALFVPPEETLDSVCRANRLFPTSFIHEMTELSLAFPPEGRNPVLLDYRDEDLQDTGYTRWFRDGLASYAGERASEEVYGRPTSERLHQRPFSALHFLGELVFEWKDTEFSISDEFLTRDEDFYRACMGLFYLLERRHGRKAIGKILSQFPQQELLNRKGLFRSFQGALGENPAMMLRGLRLPWLGIRGETFTRATALSQANAFQPGVLVLEVDPGSPAAQAGMELGDILIRVQDRPSSTLDELERGLFEAGGPSIDLCLIRSGEQKTLTVPRKRRPRDTPQTWVLVGYGARRNA